MNLERLKFWLHVRTQSLYMASFRRTRLAGLSMSMLDDIKESYPLPEGWSLKGMTVADIGCDYGNSPVFFRLMGASKVLGYERDARRRRWLRLNLGGEPWFEQMGAWKPGEYPDADVLKMDIDGGEKALDVAQLAKYRLWFVAVHKETKVEQRLYGEVGDTTFLASLLKEAGGHLVHDNGEGEEVYRFP